MPAILRKGFAKKIRTGSITTKTFQEPQYQVASEIEPAQMTALPTPYGAFGKLPKELRDSVYAMVLASGYTALTMTSQALNQDTKAALYHHGICRLTVYFCHVGILDPSLYESKHEKLGSQRNLRSALASVQTLKLNFTIPHVEISREIRRIGRGSLVGMTSKAFLYDLVASMEKPKHCHVVFTLASYRKTFSVISDAIRPLRAFESVTVELRHWPADGVDYRGDAKVTARGAKNFKMTARLLRPNGDQKPAPRLKVIWHGIEYVASERRMK